MSNESFPNFFYRGISNRTFINDNKRPSIEAFCFDREPREDGFREMSINWEFSDDALNVLFTQRKADGSIQFSAGASKLDFSLLKEVTSQYIAMGKFDYEKREVPGNIYHGNLLFKPDSNNKILNKQDETMIRNTLAMIASKEPIIDNPEIQNI